MLCLDFFCTMTSTQACLVQGYFVSTRNLLCFKSCRTSLISRRGILNNDVRQHEAKLDARLMSIFCHAGLHKWETLPSNPAKASCYCKPNSQGASQLPVSSLAASRQPQLPRHRPRQCSHVCDGKRQQICPHATASCAGLWHENNFLRQGFILN